MEMIQKRKKIESERWEGKLGCKLRFLRELTFKRQYALNVITKVEFKYPGQY